MFSLLCQSAASERETTTITKATNKNSNKTYAIVASRANGKAIRKKIRKILATKTGNTTLTTQ